MAYCTMSLKFSDHNLESPLDLVLITGRHGPYFNASTMDQFHTALKSGSEDMKRYLMSMPVWYVLHYVHTVAAVAVFFFGGGGTDNQSFIVGTGYS